MTGKQETMQLGNEENNRMQFFVSHRWMSEVTYCVDWISRPEHSHSLHSFLVASLLMALHVILVYIYSYKTVSSTQQQQNNLKQDSNPSWILDCKLRVKNY